MLNLDYCVIGGGIVGLAVGAALAPFGSVAVLEKHTRLLQETSSRNSGVVHSGLYYPAGSLKTQLCIEGNHNTWRLQKHLPEVVKAKQIGKWIGSCDSSEDAQLEGLMAKMRERDIPFEMVSSETVRREEPLVQMQTVINSTSTGIIDVHTLADYYRSVVERSTEGYVLCDSDVIGVHIPEGSPCGRAPVELCVASSSAHDSEPYTMAVNKAVICAPGLHANTLWSRMRCGRHPLVQPAAHRLYACKGRYAGYRGKAPVSRLVYPCPPPNLVGLGVHSVVDVAGHVRFGPDAVYVDRFDDMCIAGSAEEEALFLDSQYAAVHRYIPSIERDRLFADFAGVRPKLAAPGEGFRDFLIEFIDGFEETMPSSSSSHIQEPSLAPVMGAVKSDEERRDGNAVVVWLNGLESPGLTASSAIGDYVASWLVGVDAYSRQLPLWRV